MLNYERYICTMEQITYVKLIFRCQNRDCAGERYFNNDEYSLLKYLGRCYTNLTMDVILSGPNEHCHSPKLDLAPVFKLKNKIITQATNNQEPSSTIDRFFLCSVTLSQSILRLYPVLLSFPFA
jgi:hypothetical protein